MKVLITVKDLEKNKVLYETFEPIMACFFEVCLNYGGRSVHSSKTLAEIGWDMYLKDGNDTPIGKLADYLAVEVKNIKKFSDLSVYDQLDKFYSWL